MFRSSEKVRDKQPKIEYFFLITHFFAKRGEEELFSQVSRICKSADDARQELRTNVRACSNDNEVFIIEFYIYKSNNHDEINIEAYEAARLSEQDWLIINIDLI